MCCPARASGAPAAWPTVGTPESLAQRIADGPGGFVRLGLAALVKRTSDHHNCHNSVFRGKDSQLLRILKLATNNPCLAFEVGAPRIFSYTEGFIMG